MAEQQIAAAAADRRRRRRWPEVQRKIELVARSSATVLIRGESGTGKEVVARAIHAASDRRERPMLAVNCAALSREPAGIRAVRPREGRLHRRRQAAPRAIRAGRRRHAAARRDQRDRPGAAGQAAPRAAGERRSSASAAASPSRSTCASSPRPTATWKRRSPTGKFRQDLFYRLNVVPIELPPLRQRPEDIPELCRHFLHQIAKRDNTAFRHIEPRRSRLLQRYPWPGNVRELQNIIERATRAGDRARRRPRRDDRAVAAARGRRQRRGVARSKTWPASRWRTSRSR